LEQTNTATKIAAPSIQDKDLSSSFLAKATEVIILTIAAIVNITKVSSFKAVHKSLQ